MDGGRLQSVLRGIRKAVSPSGGGGLTDADLLRCWVANRDEGAFEALLWRHATAVLGVCRRVLHDSHEAEDAAQAAFLTLARSGGSIGRRQAVASWLYTVAYRAALRVRAEQARRSLCATHNLDALPGRPSEDVVWSDLRPVLDEEVSRLPEKYRSPFVLCHVEGRTNEEAAHELGCPVGTVRSRLARARQRLRDRLTQRGVTLTVAATVAALVGDSVPAAVPGVLVRAAVRAAALAAAGKDLAGVVSVEVVALTEGLVKAMLVTKMKFGVVVVLGALLFGGGSVVTYRTVAGEPAAVANDPAAAAQIGRTASAEEEKLKALLTQKEREIRELKDRLAALEDALQQLKNRQLEDARQVRLRRFHDAMEEAREVEKRQGPVGDLVAPLPAVKAPAPTAKEEQAREEVELLEAKLESKRAHLKAASLSLETLKEETTKQERVGAGIDSKTRVELVTLIGQVEIKRAELKETEVLLAQARHRLAQAQEGKAVPPPDQNRQQRSQRATELEKKLDALAREIESLRKELKMTAPRQP